MVNNMNNFDFIKRQEYLRALVTKDELIVKDNEFIEIDDIFTKTMQENRHKNKTLKEQVSLLEGIAEQYLSGDEPDKIFLSRSDNAHMNYFNVFLDNQADIITEILKSHGLSTDKLKNKGIKHNVELDTPEDSDGVVIQQDVIEDDDGYKSVVDFRIYLYGELIYSYKEELISDKYRKKIVKPGDNIPIDFEYRKDGKKRKNKIIKKEVTNSGVFTYEIGKDRWGNERIYKRKNGSRFA